MRNRLSLAIIYLCMVALGSLSLWYANYSAKESGRKFCDIITTVNDAYATDEPTSEIGVKLKRDYIELEERLGCRNGHSTR